MTNRITGTNSGIDVDTVVKQSLTTEQNKIDKAYQQQKIYEYQQEQLKSIVSDVQDFYDKYLDILSGDSLLKSTAYETASFTTTDSSGNVSTAVTAKGYAGADVTDYKVTVTQLASKATTSIDKDSVKVDEEIEIKVGDGDSVKITIHEKADGTGEPDLERAAKELNSELKKNGINVSAKYSQFAGGIVLESGEIGEKASFKVKLSSDADFTEYNGKNAKGTIKKGDYIYEIDQSKNTFIVDNVEFTLNAVTYEKKGETNLEDKGPYIYSDQYTDKDGNTIKTSSDGAKITTIVTSKDGKTKTTTIIEGNKRIQTTEAEGRTTRLTVSYLNNDTGEWIITDNAGGTMEHFTYDDTYVPKSYTTSDGYNVIISDDGSKTITSSDGKTVTKINSAGVSTTEIFNEVTLNGKTDISNLKDTIVNFINDYNKIMKTINEKLWETRDRDYMPLTEDQKAEMSESEIEAWEKKAQTGLLRNDSDLRRIQSAMKSAMSSMMSSTGLTLESIGIEPVDNYTTKNGMYKIDEDKLTQALTNNAEEVKDLFTRAASTTIDKDGKEVKDSGGVLTQLQSILKSEFKSSSSSLSKRAGFEGTSTESANTLSKNISKQKTLIKELKSKYTTKETALYNKYSALEVMLEKLNAQSNSLYSMLGLS